MEVHKELGPGFLEAVYEQTLAHELGVRRIPFERQVALLVTYKDVAVGEYKPDFVIDGSLILEVKAISGLTSAHEA
jgi:GxxExxY protein